MPHGTGQRRGGDDGSGGRVGGRRVGEGRRGLGGEDYERGSHHFHHHLHDHDICHNHYDSRPWGWYGPGYGAGAIIFRRPQSVCSVIIFFILLFVILAFLQSPDSQTSSNHDISYASRDTAFVDYSSRTCEGLSIEGSGTGAEKVQVTLFLLKREPQATKVEEIKFKKTVLLNGSYKYWMFHLLPNSKITLTTCIRNGMTAKFFLVKGIKNFERWETGAYNAYVDNVQVNTLCRSNNDNSQHFYDYRVTSDDYYYLIYESENSPVVLQLIFDIAQVLFVISSDIIADHCSVALNSIQTCSLSTGSPSYRALLQLQPQHGTEVNWEANNRVKVDCHTSLWVTLVIIFSLATGMSLLGLIATCFFMHRLNNMNITSSWSQTTTEKGRDHSTLHSDKPSAPVISDALPAKSTSELDSRPPPYNYNYHNSPPPYRP